LTAASTVPSCKPGRPLGVLIGSMMIGLVILAWPSRRAAKSAATG
jgi:hypothetical protein